MRRNKPVRPRGRSSPRAKRRPSGEDPSDEGEAVVDAPVARKRAGAARGSKRRGGATGRGRRPGQCPYCGSTAWKQVVVRHHVVVRHELDIAVCDRCGKQFNFKTGKGNQELVNVLTYVSVGFLALCALTWLLLKK